MSHGLEDERWYVLGARPKRRHVLMPGSKRAPCGRQPRAGERWVEEYIEPRCGRCELLLNDATIDDGDESP